MKAAFLDRDGVINNNAVKYYVYKISDFTFNPGVFAAARALSEKGYALFVISNQGGISKGEYLKSDVETLHTYMINSFLSENITLTEVYYCPHHSSVENCICRKPNSLLLEKAIARYSININESFMCGDSERDIQAAEKIGLKAFKVNANQNLWDQLNKFQLI